VEIADDSLLRKLAGVRRLEVNRIHHQAVERPAPGLRPVAWAGDRTIEALELSGRPVLGIQWRPENLLDDPASGRCGWWQGPSGFRTPLTRQHRCRTITRRTAWVSPNPAPCSWAPKRSSS